MGNLETEFQRKINETKPCFWKVNKISTLVTRKKGEEEKRDTLSVSDCNLYFLQNRWA